MPLNYRLYYIHFISIILLQIMWYKQQIEIAIMPRIFKGIKMGFKGDYNLKFQLVHESLNGTRTSAYPYIYKPVLPQPKSNTKQQKPKKSALTKIQNNQGHFQTAHFKITYQNQTQYLNDMCIFKLQYKMKKNGGGKTYLLIHLQFHRNVVVENKDSNLLETKVQTKTVFTQKLYINRSNWDFCKFIDVQINQTDYFSQLYMYIGSVHQGWKIRDKKINLCQFLSMENISKRNMLQMPKQKIKDQFSVGKCIKQLTKPYINTIQQFYKITIRKSIDEFKRIYSCYQKINAYAYYPETTNDLVKQLNFHETLKSFDLLEQDISDYYGCDNLTSLYFAIHHENSLLVDNIKSIWQKLLKMIKMLKVNDFQTLCKDEIEKQELKWKNNCIKYITNETNSKIRKDQVDKQMSIINQESYMSSSIASQSKLKHAKSSTNLKTKIIEEGHNKQNNKHSQQRSNIQNSKMITSSTSSICHPLAHIRYTQIQKFINWRNGYIENLNIFYEKDLSHPLIMVQNYSENHLNSKKRGIGISLVVFIHGFKGSQYDLQMASEYLLKYNEYVDILRIKSVFPTQDNNSIDQMAKQTAVQIRKHIICSLNKIDRINIIGYSLGGIVGRAALPYLENYKEKMNIFVTFSSPHLGTYSTQNNLVKAGIWYMIKFTKARALQELHACNDSKTQSKSYMKQLSQQSHIKWFNKIILVSCQQDQFVPHLSSRVEEQLGRIKSSLSNSISNLKQQNKNLNKQQKILNSQIIEMSQNFRRFAKKIERVEVWFDNQKKKGTIDKLTGRQSHIEFLDNLRFLKWFFYVYGSQF